jgi:hypothetical protein
MVHQEANNHSVGGNAFFWPILPLAPSSPVYDFVLGLNQTTRVVVGRDVA